MASSVDLRTVIGITGLRAMMQRHGGARVYIPRSHWLPSPVFDGLTNGHRRALAAAFGGESIDIPRGASMHNARGKAIPDEAFAKLRSQGMSHNAISRALGCRRDEVKRRLARMRKATAPPELSEPVT